MSSGGDSPIRRIGFVGPRSLRDISPPLRTSGGLFWVDRGEANQGTQLSSGRSALTISPAAQTITADTNQGATAEL